MAYNFVRDPLIIFKVGHNGHCAEQSNASMHHFQLTHLYAVDIGRLLRHTHLPRLAVHRGMLTYSRSSSHTWPQERIELDDEEDTDHWENLQSTNWNTVGG